MIPILAAFQIEWNKLHRSLNPIASFLDDFDADGTNWPYLAETLGISLGDVGRLHTVWGDSFTTNLKRIAAMPCHLSVRLLSGSLSEYRRATHA